jgi:hypothetical protein
VKAENIPYQLLGYMERDAPLVGLSGNEMSDSYNLQNMTTTYVTTMYYAALSNLYLQNILPKEKTKVDDEMPRVKIALERSFTDFTRASAWLKANGELIDSSPAKQYYDEVLGLGEDAVKNMSTFYQ